MIIVSAIFLAITASPSAEAYAHYQELSSHLDHQIEWIDKDGSRMVNNIEAKLLLDTYAEGCNHESFSIRHLSDWKNDKCYRIIHIVKGNKKYRVFFNCVKKHHSRSEIVTKVKITKL